LPWIKKIGKDFALKKINFHEIDVHHAANTDNQKAHQPDARHSKTCIERTDRNRHFRVIK
jgi:hypothetical protein